MDILEHTAHKATAQDIVAIVKKFSTGEALAILDLVKAQLSIREAMHQRITDQETGSVSEYSERVQPR